jgi:hypothetical protein
MKSDAVFYIHHSTQKQTKGILTNLEFISWIKQNCRDYCERDLTLEKEQEGAGFIAAKMVAYQSCISTLAPLGRKSIGIYSERYCELSLLYVSGPSLDLIEYMMWIKHCFSNSRVRSADSILDQLKCMGDFDFNSDISKIDYLISSNSSKISSGELLVAVETFEQK